jgi:hypothetical protein
MLILGGKYYDLAREPPATSCVPPGGPMREIGNLPHRGAAANTGEMQLSRGFVQVPAKVSCLHCSSPLFTAA